MHFYSFMRAQRNEGVMVSGAFRVSRYLVAAVHHGSELASSSVIPQAAQSPDLWICSYNEFLNQMAVTNYNNIINNNFNNIIIIKLSSKMTIDRS